MLFESSQPVTNDYFFDREKELGELLETIPRLKKGAPSYLALLGHRKVGKSSLLEQFLIRANKQLLKTKIDCWEKENLSLEFFRNYLIRVIDSTWSVGGHKKKHFPLEAYLLNKEKMVELAAELKNSHIKSLAAGLSALLAIEEKRYSSAVLDTIIDLPEKIAQELKTNFFVIIDEFQELGELNKFKAVSENIGNIFAFLRSHWQKHKRVNYFIAGSKITLMKKILTRRNSPFFQHFKILEIGDFPEKEACRMLKTISAASGKPIPDPIIQKMITVLGTNPFYLQVTGEELCRKGKINDDALKVTIQEILFNRSGRLYLYFEDLFSKIVGNSASLENALLAIARQEGTLTEKAKELGTTPGALKTWLNRISDVVERKKGIFQISDQALRLWLKNRSELQKILPPMILGNEAEKLVTKALAEYGFQLIYQSRASRGAFDLLGITGTKRVGIQVKKGKLPFYLKKTTAHEMKFWGKELSWQPLLALVDGNNCRFYLLKNLKASAKYYKIGPKTKTVENILGEI